MVNQFVAKANAYIIDHLSSETTRRLGEPYLAGHSLEGGLVVMKNYHHGLRINSTFDILGEAAKTLEDADRYLQGYLDFLSLLPLDFTRGTSPRFRPVSISVKPSAICLVEETKTEAIFDSATPLISRLEKIVHSAHKLNIDVTLDMEDYKYTDISLKIVSNLWKQGNYNLGKVSQARLNRTQMDNYTAYCNEAYPFSKSHLRDRLCQGIYLESKDIAATKRREIKERLKDRIREAFKSGIYVEIATHDKHIVRSALEYISKHHIPNDKYEFQFLKGVPVAEHKIIPKLLRDGHTVRLYMPVELSLGEGDPYVRRRLKANPNLVWQGAKATGRRILHT